MKPYSPTVACSPPAVASYGQSVSPVLPLPPALHAAFNTACQVAGEARGVAKHCGVPVSVTTLLGDTPVAQRAAAASAGALVVSTPARIAHALHEQWLQPSVLAAALKMLVLDEADLLLSYGYSEDLQALAVHIPRSAQCLLMSATSSAEVEQLQQLILHNPVTLNLLSVTSQGAAGAAAGAGKAAAAADAGVGLGAGGAGSAAEISHFSLSCSKEDRRLAVLSLLKLGLLKKKVGGVLIACMHACLLLDQHGYVSLSKKAGVAAVAGRCSCSRRCYC